MKLFAHACFLILPLALPVGCKSKPAAESEVQSLNNFARSGDAELVPNDCYGGPDAEKNVVLGVTREWDHVDFSEVPASQQSTLKADLKRAMSAVPQNLQELYFGLGGTIKFANDPATACNLIGAKQQFAKEGQSTAHACWTISSSSDFVIYMQPKTSTVRHATVRMFGYVLSQMLTSITLNDQNKIVYERDEAFDDTVALINKAFMDDVRNSISVAKKAGKAAKYDMAANQALVKEPDFKYYVFAESFDSFYCNKNLRLDMAKADEFPKTYSEFVKMDLALQDVKVAADTPAMGLTDAPIEIDADYNAAATAALRGGRLFGGIARVGAGIGRGVLQRGAAIGGGILRGGGAVLRTGGRVLGGAVRGTGRILGGTARVVGRGAVGVGRFLFGRRP